MQDEKDDSTRREVHVDCVAQYHRHTHCRRRDHVGNARVVRGYDFRGADQKLSVMLFAYDVLQSLLNVPTEEL